MTDWKASLVPASFRGVQFQVEEASQAGGRRFADFELPKSNVHIVEDLGETGRKYSVRAYLIGDDFQAQCDQLVGAMETEGPGTLILPTSGQRQVQPGTYATNQQRTRGRMVALDLTFIDAGSNTSQPAAPNTQAQIQTKADATGAASAANLDAALARLNLQGGGGR